MLKFANILSIQYLDLKNPSARLASQVRPDLKNKMVDEGNEISK